MKSKKENKEQTTVTTTTSVYDAKNPEDLAKLNQALKDPTSLQGKNIEVREDDQLPQDIQNNEYGDTDQYEKQQGPGEYGNNPNNDKKMDNNDVDGMGMFEGEVEESEDYGGKNPWAICTSSLGLEGRDRDSYSSAEKKKFERCVMDVKKSVKESKEKKQALLEMELEKIIKKHLPSRITKGDFLNTLSEQGIVKKGMYKSPVSKIVGDTPMDKPIGKLYTLTKKEAMEGDTTIAPTRVKPGTKEKPGTNDPFKNPKHKPKPKAKTEKDSVVKIPDYITFDQLKFKFDEK